MKKTILFGLFLLFFNQFLNGQADNNNFTRTISISEWINEINLSRDSVAEFNNIRIVPNRKTDARFLTDVREEGDWAKISENWDTIFIKKPVYLDGIEWVSRSALTKIVFEQEVHFERINLGGDLFFRGCRFAVSPSFYNIDAYFFGFSRCKFEFGLFAENFNALQNSVSNCIFEGSFIIWQNAKPLNLIVHSTIFGGRGVQITATEPSDLIFYDCRMKPGRQTPGKFVISANTLLNFLTLVRDTFMVDVHLSSVIVREQATIEKCIFQKNIILTGTNLPDKNTIARWPQFVGNRLAVANAGLKTMFSGKSMLHLDSTEDNYHELIRMYSSLLRSYKNNGDQESYNACYIEMRNITTRHTKILYRAAPSLQTFVEWRLNQFLRLFCDYGTNPVRAIICSVFVIFSFGLLYFMFPNPLENNNRLPFWEQFKSHRKSGRTGLWRFSKKIMQRMLDAFALSMNAFVTLGYGDMPARGVARYLAVLEGLTGWFLLSIFSASLISQILQ
jgi:Ion channel